MVIVADEDRVNHGVTTKNGQASHFCHHRASQTTEVEGRRHSAGVALSEYLNDPWISRQLISLNRAYWYPFCSDVNPCPCAGPWVSSPCYITAVLERHSHTDDRHGCGQPRLSKRRYSYYTSVFFLVGLIHIWFRYLSCASCIITPNIVQVGLYIHTGNDVVIYFRSAANRFHVLATDADFTVTK